MVELSISFQFRAMCIFRQAKTCKHLICLFSRYIARTGTVEYSFTYSLIRLSMDRNGQHDSPAALTPARNHRTY